MNLTKKLVTSYAKSLFQNVCAIQKNQDQLANFELTQVLDGKTDSQTPNVYLIGEELAIIRTTLIVSKTVNAFFKNPTYQEQQKAEILFGIFPGTTLTMKSFLKVLTERGHLSLLPEISEEYNKILLTFKKAAKVKVITASTLQQSYGSLLLKTLKELTSANEIILNVSYNPSLLGGLIVEYNSTSTDASILKEFSLFFNP
jgi:ATP synthase F1 delta subunit